MRAPLLTSALLATSLALGACGTEDGSDPDDCTGKCDAPDDHAPDGDAEDRSLCVGIRGNGPRITSHFGALSRILEHYGLIDGVAGGSSGSISAFLLESVQANPVLDDCAGRVCDRQEAANRAALLFKSIQGYVAVLASDSEEALSYRTIETLAERIRASDVEALLESDPQAGVQALTDILTSEDLRELLNWQEILELLESSPDPVYHARDIAATASKGLSFEATDPLIFVRPGVADFEAFAAKLGRIGNFLAGYGPYDEDAMAAIMAACATPGAGKSWTEVAQLPVGDSTCGEAMEGFILDYRQRLLADELSYPSRIDDMVGSYMHALISTSVLEGDAAEAWRQARAAYRAAEEVPWSIDFADVKFGYWGRTEDLSAVMRNAGGYGDLKTAKAIALGEASWREVLALSPAEPGLARGLELGDGQVSTGGWSDLQPVLVLKNMGCDEVVYLTRQGGAGSFLTGVTDLLGIDDEEARQLFDLADTDSAYYLSLKEADGVWCTNWDAPQVQDIVAMSADGYQAPLETKDAFFTEAPRAYPNIVSSLGIAGCTVGVAN